MVFGTENVWLVAGGGFGAFLANVLYMLGGTEGFGLWTRRFLGMSVLALTGNIVALLLGAWLWQYLLFFPILIAGSTLGYGADSTWKKILRRTIFALAISAACLLGAWAHGFTIFSLMIVGLSFAVGLGSVILGVFNPFNNAPVEQFLICQLLTLFIPFWGFVK